MDRKRITKLAYKTMGKRKIHAKREKGYIYYHGQRVAKLALNLRQTIFPDDPIKDEIIYVAGLFHDVGKGFMSHNEMGAVLVKEILKEECLVDELEEISEIVLMHNQRTDLADLSFPIKIVQDADALDHLGTMEVWARFLKSAFDDEPMEKVMGFWTDSDYDKYIKKLRSGLNYQLSKQIYADKIEFHEEFIERFAMEIYGQFHL